MYSIPNEINEGPPPPSFTAGGDWRTHIDDDADSFQQKKIAQKVNNKPGNDEEMGSRRAALQ